MSDNNIDAEIKSVLADESVDDILAGIINADGTFNENYNNLFAKYMGIENSSATPSDYDLSDHSDDIGAEYISSYESSIIDSNRYNETEANIRRKLGNNINAYDNQINSEKRPLYTSNGDVRYPSIGSGASEERVVYDSDWENNAKMEQERRKKYNEQNAYNSRSEHVYAAGGVELSKNSYRPVIEQPASPFVDPISDDDDFDRYWARQYEQNQKKSFFQDGLRGNRIKNDSVETEDSNYTKGRKHNVNQFASGDWMAVEKNKHYSRSKKDRSAIPDRSPLPRTEASTTLNSTGVITSKSKNVQKAYITKSEIEERQLEAETQNLRDTVSSIVSKYDQKQKEELALKAKAEKLRLENEQKQKTEIALQHAKKAKERLGLSENVCLALDKEEELSSSEEIYDDFSPDIEDGFNNI